MRILVTYASRHGSTRGIAERVADTLTAAGHSADIRPVDRVDDSAEIAGYDAVVLGAATYLGHWVKPATSFVRTHRDALAARPVWVFSSGPLGTDRTDAEGRDLRDVSEPAELREVIDTVHPRDHRVFFGALSTRELGLGGRILRRLPAGRALLPVGDFRDWADIESWSRGIARDLEQSTSGR